MCCIAQLPRPAHLPLLGPLVADRPRQAPRASAVGLCGRLPRHHGGRAFRDLPAKQKGEPAVLGGSPGSVSEDMLFDSGTKRFDTRPTRQTPSPQIGCQSFSAPALRERPRVYPTIRHVVQTLLTKMNATPSPANRSRPGSCRFSVSRSDSTRSTCSGCSTTASSCSSSTVPSPSTWCLPPQPWRASGRRDRWRGGGCSGQSCSGTLRLS